MRVHLFIHQRNRNQHICQYKPFFDIWVGCGLRVGCVLFANLKNDLQISAIISVRVACELRAELTSYVWVTSQAYHLLFKWNRFIIFISTKFVIEESTWWKLLKKSNKSDLKCNIKTTETAYWSSACELRADLMKCVHVACAASLLRINWSQTFAEDYLTCQQFPNLLCDHVRACCVL